MNYSNDTITADEFCAAYQAVALANCMARVMSTKLDVTWQLQGVVGDQAVAQCHARLLEVIDRFFGEAGEPSLYIWVLETGVTYGVHSHLLLHLPPHLVGSFEARIANAVQDLTGRALVDLPEQKTLLIQLWTDETAYRQWERFRYMLKGIDRHALTPGSDSLPLEIYAGLTGRFQGKLSVPRIGVAPQLDGAALAQWRQRVSDLPDLSIVSSEAVGPDNCLRYNDRFLDWHYERWALPVPRWEPRL